MFCFLLVLPSAGVSGHKLTFFLNETLYLWGRNKLELRCTHIWCFFKYIYIKLWSNKLTFSLSSCVRWAAVPEVSSPHSPETHPSRLRSASLLNVHLFSVIRPHPSTNSLWLCLFFSSLLSQVVKWSLSSSTSKLSTRTETNQRWVMFYFYYVVSAELPVEPSSQRMNVENDQQINPGWKYYNSSVTLSYIFLIILTNLHLLYVTFSLSDLFYLYVCALLKVLLIWVLPPSLVTTPDWSGVP